MAGQLLHRLRVDALLCEQGEVGVPELVEGVVLQAVGVALGGPPARERARLNALAVLGGDDGRLVALLQVPLGAGLALLAPGLVDALEVLGLKLLSGLDPLGSDVGKRQQARAGLVLVDLRLPSSS